MEKILVLDFGGQYDQLIARRVRDEHVYAEIVSYDAVTPDEILSAGYSGIIFTGGPNSVYAKDAPRFDSSVLSLGIPVLGICYGAQLMAYLAGGKVSPADGASEYGRTALKTSRSALFEGVPEESVCWMSHTDYISDVPDGFRVTAVTGSCPCAAMEDEERKLYAVQFHPEVTHTEYGKRILHNFLYSVCSLRGEWDTSDFAIKTIERLKKELAGKKVLLALSGGVDSSVAALLLHRAIGNDLTCVFVDRGLLRKG